MISPDGGWCYITDRLNHCIRSIDLETEMVSTFAGTNTKGFKDGDLSDARFNSPNGMDIDADGNLYIADRNNHSIRKISHVRVTTLAGTGNAGYRDGQAKQALFNKPRGVALDKEGNIYVADFGNNSIRKINTNGEVTTVIYGRPYEGFKDGVAGVKNHPSGMPLARINGPNDLYVDDDGTIYFTDQRNHAVRKITFE